MPAKATAMPSLRAATSGRRRSLISLTPLIDVVFILLVFFMLASSFLDWRAIDLAPPVRAGGGTPMEGAMLVEIRENDLRLAGEVLDLETLVARVAARAADHPDQTVIVRPAPGVTLQRTVAVLDRLADAGVTGLSLNRTDRR